MPNRALRKFSGADQAREDRTQGQRQRGAMRERREKRWSRTEHTNFAQARHRGRFKPPWDPVRSPHSTAANIARPSGCAKDKHAGSVACPAGRPHVRVTCTPLPCRRSWARPAAFARLRTKKICDLSTVCWHLCVLPYCFYAYARAPPAVCAARRTSRVPQPRT